VTDTPPTDVPATGRAGATSYDDVPLNRFHLKITALTFCAATSWSASAVLNGLSRVGSAIGTFLLPISLDSIGFGPTMSALTLVLVAGLLVSIAWAPETKGTVLD
jgi:hypothetical protein